MLTENGFATRLKVILVIALLPFSQFFNYCQAQSNHQWAAVDNWLQDHITQLGGRAVLMVYKDGKLVYRQTENEMTVRQKRMGKMIARKTGRAALNNTADFDENTQQPIASCSKLLSAALVMTFVDEGKLSLEDTIGRYLPVMATNGKGSIKIWQCLSHLTGIQQLGFEEKSPTEPAGTSGRQRFNQRMRERKLDARSNTMQSVIDSIAHLPMEGEPGKTFHYGNAGLQIAAAVIEQISGKDFETLFQERIAKPCHMRNTNYGKLAVPIAAGSARSTPADYMNFLAMILQKGQFNGQRVLSEKSITAMQQNYTAGARIVHSPAEAGNWGYGFGEWVNASKTPTDFASSPGLFGSFPWVDNEQRYCAFLFVVNLKNKGRHEMYGELRRAVSEAVK